jgi:hypothetical protein
MLFELHPLLAKGIAVTEVGDELRKGAFVGLEWGCAHVLSGFPSLYTYFVHP